MRRRPSPGAAPSPVRWCWWFCCCSGGCCPRSRWPCWPVGSGRRSAGERQRFLRTSWPRSAPASCGTRSRSAGAEGLAVSGRCRSTRAGAPQRQGRRVPAGGCPRSGDPSHGCRQVKVRPCSCSADQSENASGLEFMKLPDQQQSSADLSSRSGCGLQTMQAMSRRCSKPFRLKRRLKR